MTAASNTSPRAQRAARRGEAAHLQERHQEEQTGQEGLAALEEAAADAVEAGAEETDLRGDVAAAGSGLTRRGEQGAAAEADPTGTGREAHSPAAVPAAASDDDSTSPAAGPTAPPADEVVAAEEAHVEHGSADSPAPLVAVSPSPLGEVEIAAVAAEAARQPEQPRTNRLRQLPLSPPEFYSPKPPSAPLAALPRSAPPAAPESREAGLARTTRASSKSPRASRAARRELEADQEPRLEGAAGQEALLEPMGAAQGGLGMSTDGMTRGPTQTEGPERAEEGTEEHGTPRSNAAADGGAKETDGAEIELEAAAPPAVAAGEESGVAAAGVPAVLVSAGASAAAFDAGSVSPSATPQAAQAEAEGTRLGAIPEQTAEAALSPSPAPVTPAVLAAAVSAVTGVRGDAPTAEGATTAAANVGMPAAAAASRRQEHVQAEGETPRPPNGAASGAARVMSTRKPRAQPAPRRLGAGLGPGSPGPLLGWLLQGQLPSERVHRSSSAHTQEARGVSGLNEATIEATATRVAEQPAPNQDSGAHTHSPSSPVAPTAAAVATRRSARLGAVTWGPPRGGRTPWMPAGRAGLAATPQPALAANRGFRGMDRGRRGGRRGGVARLGGAEIQARTGPWRERHDRPEVLEAPANGVDAEPAEDMGDPEFMCGEEAGPESEEVSLVNEEDLGRGRNRVRGTGEGVARATSQAEGVSVQAPTVTNEVKSPATLAEDDAIWQMAGTWTMDLLQRMDQPFLVRRLPPQVLDKFSCHWKSVGSD
ncbi:unnamed protein product [Closterium sp. NIES-64]|nr:unnamed protein product [Closterium sp. NIES-64]